MKSPADIEKKFDALFESIGFRRVSDYVGFSPNFNNADYIRQSDRLIIELKILDKDYFCHGGVIDRFCAIVPAPVDVNPDGTGIYTVAWPDMNRDGRCDTFEEPIRRVLKKANRQLKETKDILLDSVGHGYVVIYMNGFTSLDPLVVARMISELLTEEFSGFSGYVLCASSPEVVCFSGMLPGLSEMDYNAWYLIAEQIGDYLELEKSQAEQAAT